MSANNVDMSSLLKSGSKVTITLTCKESTQVTYSDTHSNTKTSTAKSERTLFQKTNNVTEGGRFEIG